MDKKNDTIELGKKLVEVLEKLEISYKLGEVSENVIMGDMDEDEFSITHPYIEGYESFLIIPVEEIITIEGLTAELDTTRKVEGFEIWKSIYRWERGLIVEDSCKKRLNCCKPTDIIAYICREFNAYEFETKMSTVIYAEENEGINKGFVSIDDDI